MVQLLKSLIPKESLIASALTLLSFIAGALLESRFVTVEQWTRVQQRNEAMYEQIHELKTDVKVISQRLELLMAHKSTAE